LSCRSWTCSIPLEFGFAKPNAEVSRRVDLLHLAAEVVQLPNLRHSGAFLRVPDEGVPVRIALILTLGTLMTAAWLFVLGVLAMWLIEAIS
jgi:hypothetical protein